MLRLLRSLGLGLVGLVASDHATRNDADLAMPCIVAGDSADDRALDTAFRLGRNRRKRESRNHSAKQQFTHDEFPA